MLVSRMNVFEKSSKFRFAGILSLLEILSIEVVHGESSKALYLVLYDMRL